MSKLSDYGGINYGLGCNIDQDTGLRYGVISQHSIMPEALSDIEPVYPDCADEEESAEWFDCEPIGLSYEGEGYIIQDCLDTDLMIIKSPYFTFAQYCSPCVPGAGNLDTPTKTGIGARCYCLGHDWFENGAPYPVYRVTDAKRIKRDQI